MLDCGAYWYMKTLINNNNNHNCNCVVFCGVAFSIALAGLDINSRAPCRASFKISAAACISEELHVLIKICSQICYICKCGSFPD